MKNRLLFLFLFIVLTILFIITGAYYLLVLIVLLTTLTLVSFLSMLLYSKQIKLQLKENEDNTLLIYKSKLFPFGKLTIDLNIKNNFFEDIYNNHFDLILGKKKIITTLPFNKNKIGKYTLTNQTLILSDFLGLFKKNIKANIFDEIIQLPQFKSSSYEISKISEQVVAYQTSKSDDYDIREYRIGDSMKDIHYKISYKLSKYMIKEKHKNQGNDISVVLDLSGSNNECEKVFNYLYEVINNLQVYNEPCLVKWISKDKVYEQKIKDINDLKKCINQILTMPKCKETPCISSTWMITSYGLK